MKFKHQTIMKTYHSQNVHYIVFN